VGYRWIYGFQDVQLRGRHVEECGRRVLENGRW
jgi:hypothetical protein